MSDTMFPLLILLSSLLTKMLSIRVESSYYILALVCQLLELMNSFVMREDIYVHNYMFQQQGGLY